MSDIAALIESARASALSPEQHLLRMLYARTLRRAVVERAARQYQEAADSMREVLALIDARQPPTGT